MKLEAWTTQGVRMTADEAAVMHKPGDRYIDQKTGKWVQLHVCVTMRNHFEFMRNQNKNQERGQ